MKVQGNLVKIHQKTGRSAKGNWTLYSLGVDTEGNDNITWYSYGFKAPTVSEGSFISFEVEKNGDREQVKAGSVQLEKKTAAVAQKYVAGQDVKQDSIVRQNATSTAVNILNGMIAAEIVKLPAANKRYDWYLAQLDELVNRLFLANREPMSVEDVRVLVGGDAIEDAVDEGGPSDDDWEPV